MKPDTRKEEGRCHERPFRLQCTREPADRGLYSVGCGHLVPEGWAGFLDVFGVENIGQVRLNDNRGDTEVHLIPGEGTIDFPALFARLSGMGYTGPFSLGFEEEAKKVREWFAGLV